MLGAFFEIKAFQAPFLPKFHIIFPKWTKNKHDLHTKNVCTFVLGAIFAKSKHIEKICDVFMHFTQISTDFARIFEDFTRIFTK